MSKRGLLSNAKVQMAETTANFVTNGATETSDTIDLLGFDGCTIIVAMGNSADTLSGSLYWEIDLNESANDSDYTNVALADTDGVASITSGVWATINAPGEDTLPFCIDYIGNKRYLQVGLIATGNMASGTPMSVIAIKHHPQIGAQTNT